MCVAMCCRCPECGAIPRNWSAAPQGLLGERRHLHQVDVHVQDAGMRRLAAVSDAIHRAFEHRACLVRVGALRRLAQFQIPQRPGSAGSSSLRQTAMRCRSRPSVRDRRRAWRRHSHRPRASCRPAAASGDIGAAEPQSGRAQRACNWKQETLRDWSPRMPYSARWQPPCRQMPPRACCSWDQSHRRCPSGPWRSQDRPRPPVGSSSQRPRRG